LYEFPLIETPTPMDFHQLTQTKAFQQLFPDKALLSIDHRLTLRHQLTHQLIHTRFYRVVIAAKSAFVPTNGMICIEKQHLSTYPISRLTDKYLQII
jgi:A/G-specific adenine glycosylase